MFVPTTLPDVFESLAQVMADHKTFLECGMPWMAYALQQNWNAYGAIVPPFALTGAAPEERLICSKGASVQASPFIHSNWAAMDSRIGAEPWCTLGNSQFKVDVLGASNGRRPTDDG